MRNIMKIKKFVLLLGTLLIINCAGTAPSVGEEISNQESTESDTKIVEEEVKVETFTVQQPEAPPLPVTVFEPYMIKRGDYLIKIASREYGNSSMWREIYEWNKEEIGSDPNKIYPYNFLSLKREASKAKNCDLEFFDYQIQSGDTAWGLADEIYGDELAWVIIYMDNERLIRNNDGVLQPGTVFKMRKKLDPCS
jgi:nucleoid-associated protein YgaU